MKLRRFLDNLEIKIICLLLAIVMWFYANNSGRGVLERARSVISKETKGLITFRDVPIDVETDQLGVSLTPVPNKVTISFTCPSSAEIDPSNFRVKVKSIKNRNQIVLSDETVLLPQGLEFKSAFPREISLLRTK